MAAVASAQANRQMTIKMKQKLAAEHHKEKLRYQQATNEFRRAEEERAAKIKHEIYIRERKAVHDKYKVRFPPREKWSTRRICRDGVRKSCAPPDHALRTRQDKHLAQLRALQNYEEKVRREEETRQARERELERLEREEEELLNRLKAAQELQRSAYAELEVALEV